MMQVYLVLFFNLIILTMQEPLSSSYQKLKIPSICYFPVSLHHAIANHTYHPRAVALRDFDGRAALPAFLHGTGEAYVFICKSSTYLSAGSKNVFPS